jgi:hypothetical protein
MPKPSTQHRVPWGIAAVCLIKPHSHFSCMGTRVTADPPNILVAWITSQIRQMHRPLNPDKQGENL